MDTQTLVLVVAICALWLSVTCGCVAVYLVLTKRGWRLAGSGTPSGRSLQAPAPQARAPQALAPQDTPTLINEESATWEVKVLFEAPSPALNDRLGAALASAGAVYEHRSKTFTVAGDSSRTPILIENAGTAGQLPPLTEEAGGHPPVKGVNIKISKTNRMLSPSKLQLAKLVSLAKKLARLGGTVVDAEQQPISQAGFRAVVDGKAKV